MEYEPDFVKSFMSRTLEIATEYSGTHDATLLVNCLLGLLIVPKEILINQIPDYPFKLISNWGINWRSIKNFGKCDLGHEHELNLRQLVKRLRNSVAHFKIDPTHKNGEVSGFKFKDRNGFHAELSLEELQQFVIALSRHISNTA